MVFAECLGPCGWRQVEASELQKLCDELTSVAQDLEASEDGKPGEHGGIQPETIGISMDLELGFP
jgi:hypothetical protein